MIKVRALISAEVGQSGYRQFPVETVQAFAIDGAMDTDADQFSIDIGAPTPSLEFLLDRDTEVRVDIFTTGPQPGEIMHLHNGIADVVAYSSDDYMISITGRDFSSLATDSQAPPGEEAHVRPHIYVARDAAALGFTSMKLAQVEKLSKKFYRDGSESYWESWYRLYRKRDMWMWLEPDGTLIADKLHYAVSPTYYIGWPNREQPNPGKWLRVTHCQITKGTQQRVGEIMVFGERGDIGFTSGRIPDPSIASWKRRPLKIITSHDATSKNEAVLEAWEEIFEGKVGALEISVTIPLTEIGELVRQNNMAMVNIPEMGLTGIFFVVGCQLTGGSDGHSMVVRLRERNYSISRRKPSDPTLVKDPATTATVADVAGALAGTRWATAFASAALEFHDGWDYGLFLGVLLSICQHESSFRNVRGGGDREWYPRPITVVGVQGQIPGASVGPTTLDEAIAIWHKLFANERTNPLSPRYPGSNTAVGPMQLVSDGYVKWADDYGGKSDEYEGGRWQPAANIRAGGRVLADKLTGLDPHSGKSDQIWIGVERYYGSKSAAANRAYRDAVKKIYDTQFKSLTETIAAAGNQIPVGATTNVTVPDQSGQPFQVQVPVIAPEKIKKVVNYLLRQRGKPYEWGAEGPNSFDCSGLAWAAYQHVGITLPERTTYLMPTRVPPLTKVMKNELLAGDLVFFTQPGANEPDHMGIYLNDNHFIQAPHTGDVVKITPLSEGYYRDRYSSARRVITWISRPGD